MTGAHGKRADMLVHEREPFNAEPPPALLANCPLTPLDSFYVRGHGPLPAIAPGELRLRVDGLVAHPLELTLGELRDGRFEEVELTATLQCAGNRRADLIAVREIPGEAPWGPGATATARWRGVALRAVLDAAGVISGARHVGLEGADRSSELDPPERYGASVPLEKARRVEALLAFEMNGRPLEAVHGGPLRAIVGGYIGARSVKWLERIELRSEPWDGYYQSTAYRLLGLGEQPARGAGIPLGEIPLNVAILSPQPGTTVSGGLLDLSGYALAGGGRGIARVEVSSDDGARWLQATLLEDQGPWAWRRWTARIELTPGDHEIVARAWDGAGATQPERAETVWNTKGYVNSSWARLRVRAAG